jgi:hypothetical protein
MVSTLRVLITSLPFESAQIGQDTLGISSLRSSRLFVAIAALDTDAEVLPAVPRINAMQTDYAWLQGMAAHFPVKHQPAERSADFAFGDTLPLWRGDVDYEAAPSQIEQHGSESESLTACGGAAAFGGNSAPEVDSAAGQAADHGLISPARWPFMERKRPGTAVQHPIPR